MVGVTGLEPAASKSQTSRATNCATPRFYIEFLRFCVEVGQTVVKSDFYAFLRFCKVPKTRINKGFFALLVFRSGGVCSRSQTLKCRFFPYFTRLFGAFVSETRAFSCHKVHNSHVVQTCKWSRLWSDLKSHITLPTSQEPQGPPRWIFYCNHYSIKQRNIQVLHRSKSDTL